MSVIKNSSIYLFSNIINALVPFALLPILTRYLTTAEYGMIAIFQTLITGLVAIVGFNTLGAAARRFYDNETENELSNYNGACFILLLISFLVVFFVFLVFNDSLVRFLDIKKEWVFYVIIIATINYIVQFRLNQWQIRGKPLVYGMLQIGQSAVLFVLSIVFVVALNKSAQGRVDAHLLTSILILIASLYLITKDKLIQFNAVKWSYIKDALMFGIPLIPHVFGMFLLSSVDRFFINSKLGASQAGIYMVAMQVSMGLVILFDALNKAFVPWLYEVLSRNNLEEKIALVKKTYYYFILLLFLAGLSFIIGPVVLHIVAGNKYEDARDVIGWLCVGQIFQGMYMMVTNYLFFAKKTGRLSMLTITCGIINVILLIILIKDFGIEGVAISFAISMFLRFIGTWHLVWKLNIMPWFHST